MEFNTNDRYILVITDEHDESLAYAKQITSQLDSVEYVNQEKAKGFLGQELDAVIYDMHQQFDPNAFGAITGTIRGGGYLILLQPSEPSQKSLFLKRFNQILNTTLNVQFLETKNNNEIVLTNPPKKNFNQIFATEDQKQAVEAIIKVVTGHRRRPIVITSDRGRGKSAALGIAAAKLAEQGTQNIVICAPSKKTAEMVFKHAELSLEKDNKNNLTFYSPDELHQKRPKADLVLIDESAAIPMPLLTSFLKQYSRIVFASTQHGYEGSGRGFAINFRKVLDNEAPEWKSCKLKTPIRWQENDTLEQFTFEALLLNAEVPDESLISVISLEECLFTKINKQKLLFNNHRLEQLFGLLVSAHYQTKPSDLMHLLDDDSVNIYCLEANESIVAVCLVITEGNISSELSEEIFTGKRRLQGHLVAQALSSNNGIEFAPQLKGERISRIAVHPQLQGKGFGSLLIKNIIDRSKSDYLSTCYGATQPLISFWKNLSFKQVHVGIKRDASSGAHSVTMLYPKTSDGIKLSKLAELNFSNNFFHLLSDPLKELESDIVLPLLPNLPFKNFTDHDLKTISSFSNGSRGYENTLFLLWRLVCSSLSKNEELNDIERKVLIIKVLQKHSWSVLIEKLENEVSGKKQALSLIRQAITKLITYEKR